MVDMVRATRVLEVIRDDNLADNAAHQGKRWLEGMQKIADGANDRYELSFTVVKTVREPEVGVYGLDGRRVASLQNEAGGPGRALYRWDGQGDSGLVPPGIYVVRIEVDTDARDERAHRVVQVAY